MGGTETPFSLESLAWILTKPSALFGGFTIRKPPGWASGFWWYGRRRMVAGDVEVSFASGVLVG